jgi:hypothetical protein
VLRASLSAENLLSNGLRELDMTVSTFAALYGDRSGSYLSQVFSGNRNLENEEGQRMLALLAELRELADAVAPIPVAFKNATLLRQILQDRRERKEAAESVAR